MTFDQVHDNRQVLLLQAISGSKAYGLDTPQSDTDIKGVFFLPKAVFYGLGTVEQVNNESNDMVYYELGRFFDLLLRNNPNILELLNTPEQCVLYRHPLMDEVKPELFLSKLCRESFAGYAQSQIRKAKGLNKKIFNPIDAERKTILDFCYVLSGYRSMPLAEWLMQKSWRQEDCGLVKVPHAKGIYALFHQSQFEDVRLSGVSSGPDANEVSVDPVPEGIAPIALLSVNQEGYSSHCKDYREYWDWVEKRNQHRFEHTLEHGKNYDAKNMMHTFRLLLMAKEIALEGRVNVLRPDREFLFGIRSGAYSYDELVVKAAALTDEIDDLFAKSSLPDRPDAQKINDLLVYLRDQLYR